MATIDNNIITKSLHGMIGDTIVFRQVKGKTILANRPCKPRFQSALQKQNRQLFRQATLFAKSAMRDPEKKECYRKMAAKMNLPNAYTAALTIRLRELKGLKTNSFVILSSVWERMTVRFIAVMRAWLAVMGWVARKMAELGRVTSKSDKVQFLPLSCKVEGGRRAKKRKGSIQRWTECLRGPQRKFLGDFSAVKKTYPIPILSMSCSILNE